MRGLAALALLVAAANADHRLPAFSNVSHHRPFTNLRVREPRQFFSLKGGEGGAYNPASPTKQTQSEESLHSKWTKTTIAIAIPAIIGTLTDPLLSIVDTAFVGRIGTNSLAALGVNVSIFHLCYNCFRGTTTATTSLVASSSSDESTSQIASGSLKAAAVAGLLIGGFMVAFGSRILRAMGVKEGSEVFQLALSYLRARSFAAPAAVSLTVCDGIFRGKFDTKTPTIASLLAAGTNIVLDPIFMFTFGWGVFGAGAATTIANYAALLFMLRRLVAKKIIRLPNLFSRRRLGPRKENGYESKTTLSIVRSILFANTAMLLKQCSLLLAWAYSTRTATILGPNQAASHQISLSVWLLFALINEGPSIAIQVLAARDNSDFTRTKDLFLFVMKCTALISCASAGALKLLEPFVVKFFTIDESVRSLLLTTLPSITAMQPLITCTLLVEGLAIGGRRFNVLAAGTVLSTWLSMRSISSATSLRAIWNKGIIYLFVGRLATALIAVFTMRRRNRQTGKACKS